MKIFGLILIALVGIIWNTFGQAGTQTSKPEVVFLNSEEYDSFSEVLSQFKGKTVMVDFWATWCKPCIQEFSYYDKIEEFVSSQPELVVLYISIDVNREEKWRKFVLERELSGYHLLVNRTLHKEIYEEFKVTTIPRYMIFDKDGSVFNSNAARPSQSRALIRQLSNALEE